MRRTCICVLILLVMVTLLGSLALACTCSKSQTTSTNQPGSTTTPAATTGGGGPTPTGTSAAATSTSAPIPGMPDIADVKSLSSYRLSIMSKPVGGTDIGSVSYMKFEYVKAQKAEHAWMEDANGKVTEVYIKIGDQYWIWMGLAGMGWVEQPPQATTAEPLPSDLLSQIKAMQQDVEHAKVRLDKKGTETVNNVKCIRYEFEYSVSTDMPNLATGGTRKVDEHSSGELWVADQSGMPAVMIKSINRSEITMAGEKTVMDMEYNLTDIGANITINPPEGAFKPPAVPTGLPTSTPTTTPTATATTPPPTGGTTAFNDNFQGAWNDDWDWIDPNNDAAYNFSAHAGFLRLTVPGNNDLAGSTNYDAPRLLVPRSGDFTIETLVEFNPQEYYQGAGLLVWQDEETFLRLEFGFQGMGVGPGGAKNVSFTRQEYGSLGLVGSIDMPGTMTRIELKLKRAGDQFTAWYRLVGGIWQEIGSTELSLASTVNVGITQVTQYTSSEISADFDYFKVSAP